MGTGTASLTPAQQVALRWLVAETRAGRLPEGFSLTWEGAFALPEIVYPLRAPRPPSELNEGALQALAAAGYLLARPPQGHSRAYRVTLLGAAYEAAGDPAAPPYDPADLPPLRDFIAGHFDAAELRDLCFELGVPFDDLPGERHRDRARELVLRFARDGRLAALRAALAARRPAPFAAVFGDDPAAL